MTDERSEDRPAGQRLRQGAVLLVGAILLLLVIGDEGARFYLVPLGLGLVYLAAALAGGRRGGYWATAVVLLGWGTAIVVVQRANPDLDTAGLYLLGAGLGAVLGAALARGGVAVDPLGAAATIALAGLVLALSPQVGELAETRTYALLVGLVGLVNMLAGAFAARGGRRSPATHG